MLGIFKKKSSRLLQVAKDILLTDYPVRKFELVSEMTDVLSSLKKDTLDDEVVSVVVKNVGIQKAGVLISYLCESRPSLILTKSITEHTMNLLVAAARPILTPPELVALLGYGAADVVKMNVLSIRKKYELLLEIASNDTERELLELKCKRDSLKEEYMYNTGESHERDILLLELDRDILILEAKSNGLSSADIKKEYTIKILDYNHANNLIGEDEYQREIATINNKTWYRFNVRVDTKNVSNFEFDIDYNIHFIEALKNGGYELTVSEIEKIKEAYDDEDEFDKAIESEIIDKWLKSNLIKIVAGFLQSEDGDHFKSVLSDEPAAVIVEGIEIDTSVIDENTPIDFKNFVDEIKNRKSYR